MTDTTVRVSKENRQWLKVYASLHDCTQNEALGKLLKESDTPKPPQEE